MRNVVVWIKKVSGNFDNPMWACDGALICELVGCLLLYNLNHIIDPCNHGRYWVNGLIVDNYTHRKGDIIKGKIALVFR